MIWTSKADKLLTILRGPKPFVCLDRVTLNYKGEKFDGLGTLELDSEHARFEMDLRFQPKDIPIEFFNLFRHQSVPVIVNPQDFWEGEVTTACGIQFSMRIPPPHKNEYTSGGILRFWSRVGWIDVVPESWNTGDRFVESARSDRIQAIFPRDRVRVPGAIGKADAAIHQAHAQAPPKFHAILAGAELGVTNTAVLGTQHHPVEGAKPDFKFGLYKEEHEEYVFWLESEDHDLHVFMQFKNPDAPHEDCRRIFQALQSAVAFTHGYHSWPLLEEHCLEGRIASCRIKPYFKLERSQFQPLNEHLSIRHRDCGAMIGIATKFFIGGGPLVRMFLDFAFLHRDAGMKGVPLKVQVLTSCTIFEGLVTDLLRQHRLEEAALASQEGRAFSIAKEAMIAWAKEQGMGQGAGTTPWSRISGILGSSRFLRTQEKVKAVGDHYGFPWEGDLEDVCVMWNQQRHALAHGASGGMDFNRTRKLFNAWSRLSGTIYRLMLAEMGYTGWFRYSPMESGLEELQILAVSRSNVAMATTISCFDPAAFDSIGNTLPEVSENL